MKNDSAILIAVSRNSEKIWCDKVGGRNASKNSLVINLNLAPQSGNKHKSRSWVVTIDNSTNSIMLDIQAHKLDSYKPHEIWFFT